MSELADIIEEVKNIQDGDAWHGPSLLESLEGLTAEQAAARPIAGGHSIWEIVSHLTGWENVFRRRLEGEGKASEPEAGDFPSVAAVTQQAWLGLLDNLRSEHAKLVEVVSGLSDDELERNINHRDYSVRFLLRGIVRHHVYHAGQIGLLRKAFIAG